MWLVISHSVTPSVMLCRSELYLYLVAVLFIACSAALKSVVQVDPDNGVNNASCLPPKVTHPCRDIGYALRNITDSTAYELTAGSSNWHYLDNNGTAIFVNVHDIALLSSDLNESVVVHCKPGAGLAFQNSTNILLSNVQFLNCGALRNSTSKNFSLNNEELLSLLKFNVTLYFYQCVNVTLDRIDVLNSSIATGVVMYDTIGSNNISHSVFSGNSADSIPNSYGGGGFTVEFTFCNPGSNSCKTHSKMNINSTYLFDTCEFKDNHAYGQSVVYSGGSYFYPSKEKHQALGRGGGLSLYFKGNASKNTFKFKNCSFSQNHANWGGGLLMQFEDNATQNTVEIENTDFFQNEVYFNQSNSGGGGVRIASFVNNELFSGNNITFAWCKFHENVGWNGGGMSIMLALQNMEDLQLTTVQVQNSQFVKNHARLGSAIEVGHFPMFRSGKFGKIMLVGCTFKNNCMKTDLRKAYFNAGIGTVYTNKISIYFIESANFVKNTGTAVAIAGATLHFEDCIATFSQNTGKSGGAIALLGAAHMVVSNATHMSFFANNATEYGGAIYNKYIGLEDMQFYRDCFIQYNVDLVPPQEWGATFYFSNNRAGLLGNAIYSSSILPCSWSSKLNTLNKTDVEKIFRWNNKNWVYVYNTSSGNYSEISSEQYTFTVTNTTTVEAFPGHTVKLSISAMNELGDDITNQTVYSATTEDSKIKVKPEYTYVSAGYFAVTGEQTTAKLHLNTVGSQNWRLNINLNVLKCPPGMKLMVGRQDIVNGGSTLATANSPSTDAVCWCPNERLFQNRVLCFADSDNFNTKIKRNYWIGYLDSNSTGDEYDMLVVGECLSNSCSTKYKSTYVDLPKQSKYLDSVLCGDQHRTGILCGECKTGYGHAINSAMHSCVLCNNTNIGRNVAIYLATSYLPLLVFLIAIIFFNVRFTTGPLNAFILFAQVINVNIVNEPIFVNALNENAQKAYTFLYGIFNLNFFSELLNPFCVNNNFNTLDILLLEYAVAAFPLVMIVIVIMVIRLKDCCSWKHRSLLKRGSLTDSSARIQSRNLNVGAALIHAFVAFVVLSYTKFCVASMFILTTTTVYNAYGHTYGSARSYYAGQYSLSDATYVRKYCLPAILVLIFFATPPLLLLGPLNWFNNHATKYRCLRRIWPQDKVHIILDTFQGCFKPKMRFFAGVYFLFRLVFFICFAFSTNSLQMYIIHQVLLLVLLVMLSLLQPYKRAVLNYIDTLIVFNLGVINALSVYILSSDTLTVPPIVVVTQNILIYIPMPCFVCYLILLALNKSGLKTWYKLKAKVYERFSISANGTPDVPLKTDFSIQPEYGSLTDDSVLLARANEPNRYSRPALLQAEINKRKMCTDSSSPKAVINSSGTTKSNSYDEIPTDYAS